MKYQISKELFEAVLNLGDGGLAKVINIAFGLKEALLHFEDDFSFYVDYNYFFFECKEWALKQGHIICSQDCVAELYKEECFVKGFVNSSEQQSVFDACEYILKELK